MINLGDQANDEFLSHPLEGKNTGKYDPDFFLVQI
jgi:hypothetical protein